MIESIDETINKTIGRRFYFDSCTFLSISKEKKFLNDALKGFILLTF